MKSTSALKRLNQRFAKLRSARKQSGRSLALARAKGREFLNNLRAQQVANTTLPRLEFISSVIGVQAVANRQPSDTYPAFSHHPDWDRASLEQFIRKVDQWKARHK